MPSRSYDQPNVMFNVLGNYTKLVGADPPADYTVEMVQVERKGTYIGALTTNFRKQLAEGKLIHPTPYLRFDHMADFPPGTYRGVYVRPTPTLRSYIFESNICRSISTNIRVPDYRTAQMVVADMSKNVDSDALLQQAFANCSEELDVLTMLSEAHKTVDLVVGARSRFIDLVRSMRRGNILTYAQAIGNAWLEWRYGWDILVKDIETVTNFLNYPVRDLIVTGRAGISVTDVSEHNEPVNAYYVSHDWITKRRRELSVRANAYAKMRVKSVNAFASPFVTGWELIPYSFVADWFVSVGDALKAWDVIRSAESTSCTIGQKFTETCEANVSNVQLGTGEFATSPQASGRSTSRTEMVVRNGARRYSLIPRLRVRLTSKRILDAAALLVTRVPQHR